MSLPDELMPRYFTLTTGWHPDRIAEVTGALADGALAPVDAKRLLARTVVDLYHGDGAGDGGRGRVRPGVPGPRRRPTTIPDVRDRRRRSCATAASASAGCSRWRSRARCRRTRRAAARSSRAACASTARSVTDPDLEVAPAEVDGVRPPDGQAQLGPTAGLARNYGRLPCDPSNAKPSYPESLTASQRLRYVGCPPA